MTTLARFTEDTVTTTTVRLLYSHPAPDGCWHSATLDSARRMCYGELIKITQGVLEHYHGDLLDAAKNFQKLTPGDILFVGLRDTGVDTVLISPTDDIIGLEEPLRSLYDHNEQWYTLGLVVEGARWTLNVERNK